MRIVTGGKRCVGQVACLRATVVRPMRRGQDRLPSAIVLPRAHFAGPVCTQPCKGHIPEMICRCCVCVGLGLAAPTKYEGMCQLQGEHFRLVHTRVSLVPRTSRRRGPQYRRGRPLTRLKFQSHFVHVVFWLGAFVLFCLVVCVCVCVCICYTPPAAPTEPPAPSCCDTGTATNDCAVRS